MPITRALALLPLVSLAFVASGCSKEAASISVEPKTARLTNEVRSVQLTATPRDSAGKAMKLPVTFSSMTPTIITTSADGQVQAVSSGQGTVLVKAGEKTKKEVIVIVQLAKKIEIDPDSPMMMVGVTRGFKATVLNDKKQPLLAGGVRWTSSDPSVAKVDKHGNVKTLKEGTTTLTAHAAGISAKTVITVKHEKYKDGELRQ
ncbi:MAG: Ig-like domain-containing protein [Myxococcales bacterium]|nr:Ig-like domain-containing protein [Myxococcales bacterium]